MMRFLRLSLWLAVLYPASTTWAQPPASIRVTIKGMVCSFCAVGLKKTLGSEKNIRKVDVSLEEKKVTLEVNPDSPPSDKRLRELVKNAGYDVLTIEHLAENASTP
jgi:copper chaperone CopZ